MLKKRGALRDRGMLIGFTTQSEGPGVIFGLFETRELGKTSRSSREGDRNLPNIESRNEVFSVCNLQAMRVCSIVRASAQAKRLLSLNSVRPN
jgi:hypothetical protein